MKLGVATGNLFNLSKDQNSIIRLLKPLYAQHHIRVLELTYGSADRFDIDLNEESVQFLRSLDSVSLHFPFRIALTDPNAQRCLALTEAIARRVPLSYVVIHPDLLTTQHERTVLHKYNLPFVIENLEAKKQPLADFAALLDATEFSFVFDIGHAGSYEPLELAAFLQKYEHRICGVHLSAYTNGVPHHQFAQHGVSSLLTRVATSYSCTGIIEERFPEHTEDAFRAEVAFLFTWFEQEARSRHVH